MNNIVKAGAIIAVAIIVIGSAAIYFSPYQSCVRAHIKSYGFLSDDPQTSAVLACSKNSN